MANPWDNDPVVDPFSEALAAEGVTGKVADIARSIYQQESSGGKNTKTSNAGAVGGMQVIPSTFASVADKGWSINDPIQNARAGIRYVKQGFEASGGDPALTGAFYYGGPGGLEKARRGVAVSDPRNPGAPTTLQYGQQVAARLPKERGIVQRAVEAAVPSAQAAEPGGNPWDNDPIVEAAAPGQRAPSAIETVAPEPRGFVGSAIDATRNLGVGALRGAAGIGSTLLAPTDYLSDLTAGRAAGTANRERRASIEQFAGENADTGSISYGAGKLGTEIAGTAGAGGVLAAPVRAVAPRLANALASGGMTIGSGGAPVSNMLLRMGGGAITGGASAGLVDPETAGTGALIGGALPGVTQAVGAAGRGIGRAVAGKAMEPEVRALAQRAKTLGIDIPVDRLVSSKPLNALAASLDYVPLSGRTATMNKMEDQLNTAVSRTFGQDSSNVTQALRKAGGELGAKFDAVLSKNTVKVDDEFIAALDEARSMASKELGSDGAKIIGNQIDEILGKAQSPQLSPLKKIEIPVASGASLNKVEAGLPPIPEGFTRLYRGESPTAKFQDVFDSSGLTGERASHLKGDRFTTDIKYADYYRKSYGRDAKLSYVDVPSSIAEKGRVNASEIKLSSELFNAPFASGGQSAIDGQAAYNIKKTLDRISNRNSPEAFYARDLKQKLMDALNRSLGPAEAKAFADVRKQYGNMLALEKLAANGAEGGISIGRLANLKNINNADLQELADISAQFLKTRENPHGAMQRVSLGAIGAGVGLGTGTLPAVGAGMLAGRGANMLLNSSIAKNALTGTPQTNRLLQLAGDPDTQQLLYRAAPVALSDR